MTWETEVARLEAIAGDHERRLAALEAAALKPEPESGPDLGRAS